MAYRKIEEELAVARRIYIDGGLTNLTEIAKLTGVDRKTLIKYCEEEKWEDARKRLIVTPQEVTLELVGMMATYLEDFKEKRAKKLAIAPSSMKEFLALTRAARNVDEGYDVTGSMIRTMRKYIEHIGEMAESEFPEKKVLILLLQQTMPGFIAKVERQK